jgi:hypothetical protein
VAIHADSTSLELVSTGHGIGFFLSYLLAVVVGGLVAALAVYLVFHKLMKGRLLLTWIVSSFAIAGVLIAGQSSLGEHNQVGIEKTPPTALQGKSAQPQAMAATSTAGPPQLIVQSKLLETARGSSSEARRSPQSTEIQRSDLSPDEEDALEMACSRAFVSGPAAYNQCIKYHLTQLNQVQRVRISGLSMDERDSLQVACTSASMRGPAAFNECARYHLSTLGR